MVSCNLCWVAVRESPAGSHSCLGVLLEEKPISPAAATAEAPSTSHSNRAMLAAILLLAPAVFASAANRSAGVAHPVEA